MENVHCGKRLIDIPFEKIYKGMRVVYCPEPGLFAKGTVVITKDAPCNVLVNESIENDKIFCSLYRLQNKKQVGIDMDDGPLVGVFFEVQPWMPIYGKSISNINFWFYTEN